MAGVYPEQKQEKSGRGARADSPRKRTPVGAILGNGAPVIVFAVLIVVTAFVSPEFFNIANLRNIGTQSAIVGVVAVGMTFVILGGGIDLSVGSVLGASGVVSAMMMKSGDNPYLALAAALLVGLVFGVANGLGVSALKIQPFIMTLAALVIARGFAMRQSAGGPQAFQTDNGLWTLLGTRQLLGVPGPVIVFFLTAVLAWIVLRYTSFGRQVYAIGGSPEVARLSGVRVDRVRVATYAISGFTAGMAGIMTASRISVGAPTAGTLMELSAIAAVVIGGTSLVGGTGGVLGSVFGALLLTILANVLNLVGVDPFDQQIVTGFIIIFAVVLTATALKLRRPTARA
ncbi:MAG: Ribose transporter permease [Aeromicrobium sp.]|nr:Ribose transporter permease [Aeromicrobium sp.]